MRIDVDEHDVTKHMKDAHSDCIANYTRNVTHVFFLRLWLKRNWYESGKTLRNSNTMFERRKKLSKL